MHSCSDFVPRQTTVLGHQSEQKPYGTLPGMSKVVWENDTSIHRYIRAWVNTLLPSLTYSLTANGAAIVLGALLRAFILRSKENEQERQHWELVLHQIWLASFSEIYLISWLHIAMGHDSWSHFGV